MGWTAHFAGSVYQRYQRRRRCEPLCGEPKIDKRLQQVPRRLSPRDLFELAADEEAVGVVRQRAGLEADDVIALHRIEYREGVRGDDELLVDHKGVLPTRGVGDVELVTLLELVEVPVRQVAVGVLVAETVTGEVYVGLLPRPARVLDVDASVIVEQCLVGTGPGGNLVVLDLLLLGNCKSQGIHFRRHAGYA